MNNSSQQISLASLPNVPTTTGPSGFGAATSYQPAQPPTLQEFLRLDPLRGTGAVGALRAEVVPLGRASWGAPEPVVTWIVVDHGGSWWIMVDSGYCGDG